MDNQGFSSEARVLLSTLLNSHRARKEYKCYYSISKHSTHVSTKEDLLKRQT